METGSKNPSTKDNLTAQSELAKIFDGIWGAISFREVPLNNSYLRDLSERAHTGIIEE